MLKFDNVSDSELCHELLSHLITENFNEAYNVLLKVEVEKLYDSTFVLSIALFVYQQLGQFHRISTLLDSEFLLSLRNIEMRLKILQHKIEADFFLSENLQEFQDVQKKLITNFKLPNSTNDTFIVLEAPNRLKVIFLQCQIQTKQIFCQAALDVALDTLFPVTENSEDVRNFLLHFFNSYLHFYSLNIQDFEIARNEIREAMQFESALTEFLNICNITALNARILIARGQRQLAISQLVNGAQKNAYSSEIFCLLAENLFATSVLEKAKLCAERSRLLNPRSEKAAKLLYEISIKQVLFYY